MSSTGTAWVSLPVLTQVLHRKPIGLISMCNSTELVSANTLRFTLSLVRTNPVELHTSADPDGLVCVTRISTWGFDPSCASTAHPRVERLIRAFERPSSRSCQARLWTMPFTWRVDYDQLDTETLLGVARYDATWSSTTSGLCAAALASPESERTRFGDFLEFF